MPTQQQTASETDAITHRAPYQSTAEIPLPQTPLESTQARYKPEEVERIIARASALQDTHRQTLSPSQVEAIASEVGIDPEFVRRALEQEQNRGDLYEIVETETVSSAGSVTARVGAIAVIFAYAFLTAILASHPAPYQRRFWTEFMALLLPPFVAVLLGGWVRSRRWGASLGAALALSTIAAVGIGARNPSPLPPEAFLVFAAMLLGCAALGAAGAQVRREVSRRLKKNRGRRTIARPARL